MYVLSLLGFLTIIILLYLVLSKKTSIHFALVLVPIVFALIGGFSFSELGEFMGEGLSSIAQTGIMLTFAVLFFGIMYDVGLFDPVIKTVIKVAGGDPLKIVVGTAIIAMLAHLDGSGASTFLIVISALLPVYKSLNMSALTLATVAALSAGTMNLAPWGGPTIRAITSLDLDITELYTPMIPVQIVGLVTVILISFWLGRQERKRVGIQKGFTPVEEPDAAEDVMAEDNDDQYRRSNMFIVNVLLTIIVIVSLITGIVPLAIPFIVGVPLALILNYRDIGAQQRRIEAHAKGAIYTSSVIFSAGIFIGILGETGMIESMAGTLSSIIPAAWAPAFPVLLAFFSVPLSLIFDPDSFYFGVLPVLSSTAGEFGISSVDMASAAIIGQHTVGFPVSPLTGSTWLLVGLTGVHLGDLQKKVIPLAMLVTTVMTIAAILLGILI